VAVVASAAAGCVHEYAYVPVGPGTGNGPAARYPIPPDAPRGEVYVTSFGFTLMDVAQGRSAQMMHARVVAVNNTGQETWTLDGRDQQLVVAPGQPLLQPAFANTDAGAGPVYAVPPGQRRVLDLYYAVPPPFDDPTRLGSFELDWRVNVGNLPIASRTPFQRLEGAPAGYAPYPDYVFVGLGWAPLWWYGPFFPHAYAYRPVIHNYYYPPIRARTYGPTWRGVPPGGSGWRGSPPGGSGWRGSPPSGGSGWRGSPPSGGARGMPSGARGGGRGR
jgi:hypothetical protein